MTSEKQRAAEIEFKPTKQVLKGQKLQILTYIDTFGSITPADAWEAFNCTKLSTRIGEIEKRCGVEFKHERESNGNTSYMRYSFASGLSAISYLLPTDEKVADMLREMTKS